MSDFDNLTFREIVSQPTANGRDISAGFVEGDECDSIYLRFDDPDGDNFVILLKPFEAASLAWAMSGVLYSLHIAVEDNTGKPLSFDAELQKWVFREE